MYYFCVILIVFVTGTKSSDDDDWDYTNIHCRDNHNSAVDWWYIYKPPINETRLKGSNFTYILPNTHGRWKMADYEQTITRDSMLQYTLEPLFRQNNKDHLAYLINYGKTAYGHLEGSIAHGIMVANEVGGVWIGHSIPGFPNLNEGHANFPAHELPFGHFLMCLSLDLPILNLIASLTKEAKTAIVSQVPQNLRSKLPFWQYFNRRDAQNNMMSLETDTIDFVTSGLKLPVRMMVRRPYEPNCLHTRFARQKKLILDVYNHAVTMKTYCRDGFGVRRINSISVKTPEPDVFYLTNTSDRFTFAVSTAANWQTTGPGPAQYWACVSTTECGEKAAMGAIMLCVQDYNIWWTFDNLKIKEPNCCL